MVNKLVLVEGKNDLNFIGWLVGKAKIDLTDTRLLRVKNGKGDFIPYVTKKVLGRVNDVENGIDYTLETVNAILIIKDFDKDDVVTEFDELTEICRSKMIDLDVCYIAGSDCPPKLLESIFIQNNGELLRDFADLVKTFNDNRKALGKDYLSKINDKAIYHGFRKIQNANIYYKSATFDSMFGEDFLKLNDIKCLLEKIQLFVNDSNKFVG